MTTTAIGSTAGVAGGSMGVSGGTSSSKCDCGCSSCPLCTETNYLKFDLSGITLGDAGACFTVLYPLVIKPEWKGQLKNLTLTSPIYVPYHLNCDDGNQGCVYYGVVGTVDIYAPNTYEDDWSDGCDIFYCTVPLILGVKIGVDVLFPDLGATIEWSLEGAEAVWWTSTGGDDPGQVFVAALSVYLAGGGVAIDDATELCDGVTTDPTFPFGALVSGAYGGVAGGTPAPAYCEASFWGPVTGGAIITATNDTSGGSIATCPEEAYICSGDTTPPADSWIQLYPCVGPVTDLLYMTLPDIRAIPGTAITYMGKCYTFFAGINVTTIPDGGTVVSLSDVTAIGSCTACLPSCYVQARKCLCDSTPTGGDDGDLVDAWFLCTDIPGGGAFTVTGIGCCYIKQLSFFGPSPGFPDGSETLDGTLYASTDVTPSPSCLACIGCPDTSVCPDTLSVTLSGIPNNPLTTGGLGFTGFPCTSSTDGTYTLTNGGGGYGSGSIGGDPLQNISISCEDVDGVKMWKLTVSGYSSQCPPSSSAGCSVWGYIAIACCPTGTYSLGNEDDRCSLATGGTAVVS